MSTPRRDPLEALGRATGAGTAGGRSEPWTRLALLPLGLTVLAYLYLGSRPGGPGPAWVFTRGRDLLTLLALALLAWGLARSALRRPFLQPGRARALVALVLVVGIAPFPFPYPTSHVRSPSAVAFELPVEGEWRVLWGGERGDTNRVALVAPDRCSALHLVREEDLARVLAGERGQGPEGWDAFGAPLLAPAAGRVVAAVADLPDGDLGRAEGLEAPGDVAGNRVVLEVAPGQFLHLDHLRQGSLRVGVGDEVRAGQPLAEVGSSGLSGLTPWPHVALYLSDSPEVGRGEGIPWTLVDYRADGRPVERGMPTGGLERGGVPVGQRVRRADGDPR